MKKTSLTWVLVLSLLMFFASGVLVTPAHAVSCLTIPGVPIPVGGGNTASTAAVLATTGSTIISPVDGGGVCDVGVYVGQAITGVVISATVHDALKVGVLVNGGTADVTDSAVSKIGNHAGSPPTFVPNGVQTGIDVLYRNGASGTISSSEMSAYQKGGIVVKDSAVDSIGNTVTGLGPVDFIAQNGIEYAFSATGTVRENSISGNFYTGLQGLLANGTPCGPGHAVPTCPPGRLYVSTGLLLVFVSPGSVQRGQNDISNNQRPEAVIPSVPASP